MTGLTCIVVVVLYWCYYTARFALMEFSMFESIRTKYSDLVVDDPKERLATLRDFLENQAWPAVESVCSEEDVHFESLFEVLDGIDLTSSHLWAPVSHSHSVRYSDHLNEVVEEASILFNDFSSKMNRYRPLYEQLKKVQAQDLNDDQARVVSLALRDLRLAGCNQTEAKQTVIKEVKMALSQATLRFNRNVIKSSESWSLHITQESRLIGIPDGHKTLFKSVAESKGLSGWCITLGDDVVSAVLSYADDSALRKQVYQAYITRASDQQDFSEEYNNDEVISEILVLRKKLATLLEFDDYVALSFEKKMAPSGAFVTDWLMSLLEKAKPKAERELSALLSFAESQNHEGAMEPWDIAYWHERYKRHLYQVDEESLRDFFPLDQVKKGIQTILSQLFDVSLQVKSFNAYDQHGEHWHLHHADGQPIGDIYLDLLRREGKQSGAWMNDFRSKKAYGQGQQLPACHVVANFMPSAKSGQIILAPREVVTLFHELGHAIHHVLSKVPYPSISGIGGVAWDAVEVPSQWFEFWSRHVETLPLISCHITTGKPIDVELISKLNLSQHLASGRALCRQIEFAWFDLAVHQLSHPDVDEVRNVLDGIRKQCRLIPAWENERFQNSFRHIFGGGYAAGYYSYKWAEVLSCDVFAYFEEHGLLNTEAGKHFLNTYLAQGGRKVADALFSDFRSRAPKIDALLKYTHINDQETTI